MRLPGRLFVAAALLVTGLLATGCASGRPPGATLGITGRTVVDEKSGKPVGVRVAWMHARSPLAEQGVRPGDLIVAVEGEPPGRAADLGKRVFESGWQKPLHLAVRRGDVEREIEVLPAPAYRKFRIGLFIPFLWDTEGDFVEILTPSLVGFGTGPDDKGFLLLSCVGFTSRPDSNAVWLGVLYTGTGIGPPEERPKPAPADGGEATSSP